MPLLGSDIYILIWHFITASGCSEALSPQSITTQTISSASNNSNIGTYILFLYYEFDIMSYIFLDQKSDDDTAGQTLIGNVIDGMHS